ncbi:prolyl oligopeptidase family protein [Ochrobactrum teleogrylli]|uniref:S9 family peptidase n=1 Tax=Ochrobactrum teleogrylli TaxID=2479765 RepID=A0ABY2Y7S0_9HYPH|nr:prolyl oligopeptidase family serine peptidase [[Ochrobactrum] teleogrylli]TNV17783.1 S9 family peptidase [[Ochrobactrum] teleogrylli]
MHFMFNLYYGDILLKIVVISTIVILSSVAWSGASALAFDNVKTSDENIYLEDIHGPAALKWVAAKNEATLQRLRTDPRYAEFDDLSKASAANATHIAYPAFGKTGELRNFWMDDVNLRGLWRATNRDDYFKGKYTWRTILDIDALAAKEGRNWIFAGAMCHPLHEDRCLLSFSDGGKDAVAVREFDRATGKFLPSGFTLPEAKQIVSWGKDLNTIYVSREWDQGDVTESGYAYITKVLQRGQSLGEAREIFRGEKTDISAYAGMIWGDTDVPVMQMNTRQLSGEEMLTEFVYKGKKVVFPLPTSSHFLDLFEGQLIYRLKEDWKSASGTTYAADSIISFDLAGNIDHPEKIEPVKVFVPSGHQAIGNVSNTENRLLIEVLSDVAGQLYSLQFEKGVWHSQQFQLPKNASVALLSADTESDELFLTVEGFLEPTALYWADAASMDVKLLQTEHAEFDASDMQVTQNWVSSKDGTKIPYFMVSKKGIPLDGSNPTLITAYGGFEISLTPQYLGIVGKMWLEKGGVYVLPNIRGGGEFGAKWHRAGLKTNRQRVYDDVQAVAEDLIARKITSPRRLGVSGGSNGGLMAGVQLVQRPELWNAVIVSVPLLDMVRYNVLSAGASWMSEYGDPADPVEGAFLRSISPYHNLKPGTHYPEPFFITSQADDRVHPGHARKMAARMDAMGIPNLFFESDEGGHSAVKTSWENTDSNILQWVYLMQKLMD